MKSIEERIDALVARATKEKAIREVRATKEKAIREVLELCLDALEKFDDVLEKGVTVHIPIDLIKKVPEWTDRIMMGASLIGCFQKKVTVDLVEQTEIQKQDGWDFKLYVNSMP